MTRSVHSPAGSSPRCRAEPKRNAVVNAPDLKPVGDSVETAPEGETSSTVRSRKAEWLKWALTSTNSTNST